MHRGRETRLSEITRSVSMCRVNRRLSTTNDHIVSIIDHHYTNIMGIIILLLSKTGRDLKVQRTYCMLCMENQTPHRTPIILLVLLG